MLKVCSICGGVGYEKFDLDGTDIDLTCDNCMGLGTYPVPSVKLLITVYKKPLTRQLLSIQETINRPNNPEVYEIVDTWVKYHYGDVRYDYCEVDSENYEIIDEDWNIEDYL